MKVSLNIVAELTGLTLPPVDELVAKVNAQLGGVEEIIHLGERYKDARIVRVVHCEKHANADKLSVTKIDDGGVDKNVPRDEDGLVQVVCGAPNVHADMWAVWLPPRSVVPATFGDETPFVLDARELRGVLSQGMLAAADELAIGSDHAGIIELTERDLRRDTVLTPGASFAEVFGLDDTIIDIENKMFTHRPDLFGQLGVAREISAILQGVTAADEGDVDTRFQNPEWYWLHPDFDLVEDVPLEIFNDIPDLVPRLMAVAMKNVEIKPSPLWLQCALVSMGSKPINNVVDATNYMMLLTGQPTHAYDYDKLRGHKLGARMAKNGETISLLNGKTYELTTEDIVIADAEGPVGVGGIMGGADSEVSAETTNIVLEVATFDMYAVRKTSMRHGLFTDALTRFNKGQSPLQNSRVLRALMTILEDVSSSKQASPVADIPNKWEGVESLCLDLGVSSDFVNERLGTELTADQIGNLLRRTNFASQPSEDTADLLHITAPFWRTDISIPEDIVEEVGRLYGFDTLPRVLPARPMKPAHKNQSRVIKEALRSSLARLGANEVLTYSFVHENSIRRAGQDASQAFRLSNALSPELQYYRVSVLPSLLEKVHMNIKAGHDEFLLYEIGKAHDMRALDNDGLPIEFPRLAGAYAKKTARIGAPYYLAKRYVEQLAADMNFAVTFKKLSEFDEGEYEILRQLTAPFDPERASIVYVGEKFGGVVGELRQTVQKNFKLPETTAGFELFLSLFEKNRRDVQYTPLSKYPRISQDVSLKVVQEVPYAAITHTLEAEIAADTTSVEIAFEPIAVYQSEKDTATKTITIRLTLTPADRTLSSDEAQAIVARITDAVVATTGAIIV